MQKNNERPLRLPNFENSHNSRVMVLAENPFNFLTFAERRIKVAPVEEYRVPPINMNVAVDILFVAEGKLSAYAKQGLCVSALEARKTIYGDTSVRVIFCKSDWQIAKRLKKIFPETCKLLKVPRPKRV